MTAPSRPSLALGRSSLETGHRPVSPATPTAPHPNLYLVGRGAAGWQLETAVGTPVITRLASPEAARDAAWAAGYREGGTLKDGTEWLGYVPGALPSPFAGEGGPQGRVRGETIAESLSAIVVGLFATGIVAGILSLPFPPS